MSLQSRLKSHMKGIQLAIYCKSFDRYVYAVDEPLKPGENADLADVVRRLKLLSRSQTAFLKVF